MSSQWLAPEKSASQARSDDPDEASGPADISQHRRDAKSPSTATICAGLRHRAENWKRLHFEVTHGKRVVRINPRSAAPTDSVAASVPKASQTGNQSDAPVARHAADVIAVARGTTTMASMDAASKPPGTTLDHRWDGKPTVDRRPWWPRLHQQGVTFAAASETREAQRIARVVSATRAEASVDAGTDGEHRQVFRLVEHAHFALASVFL